MNTSAMVSVLTKVAPVLGTATALGGPLAGPAISVLEKVFGLNATGDLPARQESITAAMAGATPEQLLAVRKADNDFQARMAELGFESAEALAKLGNEDRASARQPESTAQSPERNRSSRR